MKHKEGIFAIIDKAQYNDFDDYCVYKKKQQKPGIYTRIPTLRQWKNILQKDHILIARDRKSKKICGTARLSLVSSIIQGEKIFHRYRNTCFGNNSGIRTMLEDAIRRDYFAHLSKKQGICIVYAYSRQTKEWQTNVWGVTKRKHVASQFFDKKGNKIPQRRGLIDLSDPILQSQRANEYPAYTYPITVGWDKDVYSGKWTLFALSSTGQCETW